MTKETLYRLFLPDLLPDLTKVLWLDCDLLLNQSIHKLWETGMGKFSKVAVQSLGAPFFNSEHTFVDNPKALQLIGNCFFKAKIQVACGPRVGWGAGEGRVENWILTSLIVKPLWILEKKVKMGRLLIQSPAILPWWMICHSGEARGRRGR